MALTRLDEKDFPHAEWAALSYAREWAMCRGLGANCETRSAFMKCYTPSESARIHKLLRMMLFANYCGNALYKRPWNKQGSACSISFEKRNE